MTPILIISLLVLSIHYTMQEDEIFGSLGNWLEQHTPYAIHPALFDCNVCMTPWYGSILYVVIYGVNWQWPVVVIAAMGVNVVINKLAPKDCEEPRVIESNFIPKTPEQPRELPDREPETEYL